MIEADDGIVRARQRTKEKLAQPDPVQGSKAGATQVADAVRADTTRKVLWIYGACIALIAILIVLDGVYTKNFGEAADNFFEVVKVGVLPVVTFVLGRYFGSSR